MRKIKIYLAFVAMAAMLFTSCSKEDSADGPDGPNGAEMVALSFKGALSDFTKKVTTKQAEEEAPIPECSDNSDPDHVKVGVKDSGGNWVSGGEITIDVIPVSVDSDGDGATNYLTFEAEELELEEGDYTLEYFAVYNSNGDLILMAPRSDNDYGPANFYNFVESPLPQDIELQAGTKHYQEVEVLCYDEQEVQEYGYLFFDFEEVPLTYICIFGNECDENGRHTPSHFRVKVWEYPAMPGEGNVAFTDENALVNGTNDFNNGANEGEVTQADPLCFPLPDRDGENWFYGEIYTIDENGVETLIRRGDFSDEDTKDPAFAIEGKQKYWHFREGPFCGEDSDPCLLSSVVEDWVQDFGTGVVDLSSTGLITDYIDVDTNNDGDYTNADNPGVPSPFGGYLVTNDPSKYYDQFPGAGEAGDDGNMIVFDGSPDSSDLVLYTMETPELCKGDTYFLKMRLKDISTPDRNNARLRVHYRSGNPEGATLAGNFEISSLVKDGDGIWSTVGFVMTATEDGSMIIRIRDSETDNSGNDFAMDDIVLSNDPTILNTVNTANKNVSN